MDKQHLEVEASRVAADPNIAFHKHIMMKKNALSSSQCAEIIKITEAYPSLWEKSLTGNSLDTDYRSNDQLMISAHHDSQEIASIDKVVYDAFHKAAFEYQCVYGTQFIYEDEGYGLLRYKKEQEYRLHFDSNKTNRRLVSGLLYLNEEFDGGQTDFPAQSYKVQPESGMVCLFPSIYTHPHASLPVVKGTKYVIVTWFRGF